MPRYIFKINDKYMEWSTVVDAPVTYGMSRDEFVDHYLETYGKASLDELTERLARVDATGTSSLRKGDTVDALIQGNRAGPNETELSKSEIIKTFC